MMMRVLLLSVLASCATGPTAARGSDKIEPVGNASAGGHSLQIGGHARTYALHLPANATHSLPLVIVLHGGFGNGERTERGLGFDALADREGFAVVYPDGLNHHWNDSRKGNDAVEVDDVAFIRALIDELVSTQAIDGKRVFVTGPSNGGMMSYRLGCELADRIVAIAPVIGGIPSELAPACHPARALSVLAINGVDDPLVPYNGGPVARTRGEQIGALASTALFAHAAGCTGEPNVTEEPDRDPGDGTTVERRDYTCPLGISIVQLSIAGGGHTWPGAAPGRLGRITGRVSHEFSATERIWRFFSGLR